MPVPPSKNRIEPAAGPLDTAEEFSRALEALEIDSQDRERLLGWVTRERRRRALAVKKLKKTRLDFSTMTEIAGQIASRSLDLKRFNNYIISTFRGQFGVAKVFLLRQDPNTEDVLVEVGGARRKHKDPLRLSIHDVLARHFLTHHQPQTLAETREALGADNGELERLAAAGAVTIAPLARSQEGSEPTLHGVLILGTRFTGAPLNHEDMTLLAVLTDMLAISLNNAELYRKSVTDALTRIFSRGHFDAQLHQEVSRAQRQRERLEAAAAKVDVEAGCYVSLVMMDIDHFKKFNDSYGHQTGDLVLQRVAACLENSVREMDVVARYGGEEFAVVLPDTRHNDAKMVAERLRRAIEALQLETQEFGGLRVTGSFGVATYPDDAVTMQELIARADAGLYLSKEAGRNAVSVAGPHPPRGA